MNVMKRVRKLQRLLTLRATYWIWRNHTTTIRWSFRDNRRYHRDWNNPYFLLLQCSDRYSSSLKPIAKGREKMIDSRGAANILSLVRFYLLQTGFSTSPVHLPKTIVLVRGVDFQTIRRQPRKLSKPMKDGSAGSAVYKLSKSTQLQIQNHEDVKKLTIIDLHETALKKSE